MDIFDKIIASGYYVFEGQLNSHIVRQFINIARSFGKSFKSNELKMNKMRKYIEFDNYFYRLKNGYTVSDISEYIDLDMVTVYHNLKIYRDKFYSGTVVREEPTFENAMIKVMKRKR